MGVEATHTLTCCSATRLTITLEQVVVVAVVAERGAQYRACSTLGERCLRLEMCKGHVLGWSWVGDTCLTCTCLIYW